MRYIYTLSDPDSFTIRYIGQTNNIKRRFNDHISTSTNENSETYNTHKSNWIRKLLSENKKPIINIIKCCVSLEESNLLERFYIEKFTNDGIKLTNSHSSDITEFSQETRKKMSEARLGKSLEEMYGIEKAEELKRKFTERTSEINKKPKSEKTKIKISETLKDYFKNKENHWAYGRKMSDEHNEKLRLAKLNNPKNIGNRNPRTEEQREKIRQSILGKKVQRYKILQYDLEGNFIKEWISLREIERNNPSLKKNQVSKCCKGEKSLYGGFIWKYNLDN